MNYSGRPLKYCIYNRLCGCYVNCSIVCVPSSPTNYIPDVPSSLGLRPSQLSGATSAEWEEKGQEHSNIDPSAASETVIKNAWSFTFTLLYAFLELSSGEGRGLPSFTTVLNTMDFD
jgi:hypothetical protein